MKESPKLQVMCPLCDAIQYTHNRCTICGKNFRFYVYPQSYTPHYKLKEDNGKTIKPRA